MGRPGRDRSQDEGDAPELDVECPSCLVAVGKLCVGEDGAKLEHVHRSRVKAFAAAGYTHQ